MERNYMNESFLELVKERLIETITDLDNDDLETNCDDGYEQLKFIAFNQDIFITYHAASREALIKCDYDALEAIGDIQEWEMDVMGEKQKDLSDYETVVSMLAYIYGESLVYSLAEEFTTRETLIEEINNF